MAHRTKKRPRKKSNNSLVVIIASCIIASCIIALLLLVSLINTRKSTPQQSSTSSRFTEKQLENGRVKYANEDPNVTIFYPQTWKSDVNNGEDEAHSIVNLPGFVLKLNGYYVGVSRLEGYKFQINPLVQENCIYDAASHVWTVQTGNFHYSSSDCDWPRINVAGYEFFQANTGAEISRKYEYLTPILNHRYMLSIGTGYKKITAQGNSSVATEQKVEQIQDGLNAFVMSFIEYNPVLFE